MGLWSGKVSDIKPALTDWLAQRGGTVSDLPLNLINRSIQKIWAHRPWDFLIKTSSLSMGVEADFSYVESLPGYIECTDTSDGAIIWDWDWGDDTDHSTDQNPTHEYAAQGTYDVTLSINNGASTVTYSITTTGD